MMKAYDLEIGDWCGGSPVETTQGWCFGLPPGLKPEHWPLDPVSGYPLMHGFTLRLPDDYRVHGPDIVALSFFATACDQNDGGASPWNPELTALIDQPTATPPADPALRIWWEHLRLGHPRLHRMSDILDYGYAVILLTEAEFQGPPCRPPAAIADPRLAGVDPPVWLAGEGSANAYSLFISAPKPEVPGDPLLIHRPLRWSPRAQDPNAGLAPRETYSDEPADTGYQRPYYWENGQLTAEAYREHDWAKGHGRYHIGGTMAPVQGVPPFSPYYVEFEEDMGGYNFGGGNGQLDFRDMQFDWACG